MNVKVPLAMLLLIVVNGCLLTALGWRLTEGSQRADLLQTKERAPDVTFDAVDVPGTGAFDSIQTRAIFHQSRSFYVAPPPQVVEQPPPDYRLAGSMSVAGRQSAVLINAQTGARLRVGMGDQVDGWTVAAIQPGRVTLQSGARVAEITPSSKAQGGGGVTVTSAQATAVPSSNTNGVRLLGNAPLGAPRPQSVSSSTLDQAPRLYRPPRQ
jgi:hypothetical protein